MVPHTATHSSDHPRSRGEYGAIEAYQTAVEGSSPLSRGILIDEVGVAVVAGIIPALAGNTPCANHRSWNQWDHPRSRGEYPGDLYKRRRKPGSSPLSRGIRMDRQSRHPFAGIIPALAGNTTPLTRHHLIGQDHPRSRGEYNRAAMSRNSSQGSSPLSRGIRRFRNHIRVDARIIPALAGNTG